MHKEPYMNTSAVNATIGSEEDGLRWILIDVYVYVYVYTYVCDQFGVSLGLIWGQLGIDSGSMWGRFAKNLGNLCKFAESLSGKVLSGKVAPLHGQRYCGLPQPPQESDVYKARGPLAAKCGGAGLDRLRGGHTSTQSWHRRQIAPTV